MATRSQQSRAKVARRIAGPQFRIALHDSNSLAILRNSYVNDGQTRKPRAGYGDPCGGNYGGNNYFQCNENIVVSIA